MATIPNLHRFSSKLMFAQTDCHTIITLYGYITTFSLFYVKSSKHCPASKFYFITLKTTYLKPKLEVLFYQAHFHNDSIRAKLYV